LAEVEGGDGEEEGRGRGEDLRIDYRSGGELDAVLDAIGIVLQIGSFVVVMTGSINLHASIAIARSAILAPQWNGRFKPPIPSAINSTGCSYIGYMA